MRGFDVADPRVVAAIAAIDTGNSAVIKDLISKYPGLVEYRIHNHEEGYFKDPYLLWFVAGNPVRIDKLPDNIITITRELVDAVKRGSPGTYQYQLDYTLGLVVSGDIARKCGVQMAMIDLLIDAGASPDCAMDALTNGNLEAAAYLVSHGSQLKLALAVCLGRMEDSRDLIARATMGEKTTALAAAAYYGNESMIKYLLEKNTAPNGFPEAGSGFHAHATALHQAVSSGSLACVKLLVEAGAKLAIPDKIYNGTPLDWAAYLRSNTDDETKKRNFSLIEDYLRLAE